jgi:hypothetical protein
MEALTSRRSQGTRVGHTNSFRHRITRLERSRSSGSTSGSSDQRDGARESAHLTRARPQGSRDGSATTDRTGTPNDRGTTRGFLLRRARPPRAAGAWRVVVTTSRHVPHSFAPLAQRPTVRAVVDRAAVRRQARRDDARPQSPYRPRVQAASFSGRNGQPRVDSTTQSSLLVNAGLSCVDEEDHGTGRRLEGERDRAVSPVARDAGRMSVGRPTRRCLRSSACWHVRPHVKFLTRPSWSRAVLSKRTANGGRHLRPVLLRESARRVDR